MGSAAYLFTPEMREQLQRLRETSNGNVTLYVHVLGALLDTITETEAARKKDNALARQAIDSYVGALGTTREQLTAAWDEIDQLREQTSTLVKDNADMMRALDQRIDDMHGKGAAAAIDEAFADGSIFSDNHSSPTNEENKTT